MLNRFGRRHRRWRVQLLMLYLQWRERFLTAEFEYQNPADILIGRVLEHAADNQWQGAAPSCSYRNILLAIHGIADGRRHDPGLGEK